MFFGIIILVIGVAILLNGLGVIVSSNFWAILWGIIFIAIGLKMMMKRGFCPMCRMGTFGHKMHGKFHGGKECCESKERCEGKDCCGECCQEQSEEK